MYLAMFYATTFALPETATISFSAVVTGFVVGSFAIAFTNGGFAYYPIFIAQILVLFLIFPYENRYCFRMDCLDRPIYPGLGLWRYNFPYFTPRFQQEKTT